MHTAAVRGMLYSTPQPRRCVLLPGTFVVVHGRKVPVAFSAVSWPRRSLRRCFLETLVMPFDSSDTLIDPPESAAELLAKAARIRRHAWTFAGDPAEKRLEQIADELEAKARQAERARI
jgi:hypothetical protein